MFKHIRPGAAALALLFVCTACTTAAGATPTETLVTLSDSAVTVDGKAASTTAADPVYVGADIVYYETGRDAAYGEGTDADAHPAAEAAGHTVITITQPGTYRLTGALSAGQVAVDLGADAETDPDAVVTLILDNVDITCTVAPAIIFYRVYECGSYDLETAAAVVDTAAAGANVVIADGSVNDISGSYVAKIYKEGTDKKLHKYDGAFYSKMSMNVTGGTAGDGVLNITAENEGLDSELHLTIDGGYINITAQNDGINTSEDGVSVATVNGGVLTINSGLGAEGDGVDSNGFVVVNGGTITTQANPKAGEGGLDADMGVTLNGGTIVALGSRNDDISAGSTQLWMELNFSEPVSAGSTLTVKDSAGAEVLSYTAVKDFQAAVLSAPSLALDAAYTVYVDGVRQQYTGTSGGMMGGGQRPQGEFPADGEAPPEGGDPAQNGERPQRADGAALPDGATPPQGGRPADADETGTPSTAFTLTAASKRFSGVSAGA